MRNQPYGLDVAIGTNIETGISAYRVVGIEEEGVVVVPYGSSSDGSKDSKGCYTAPDICTFTWEDLREISRKFD